MDKIINGENNSMNSLSFLWTAIFSDNSKIEQFETNFDNSFKRVQIRFTELNYFVIYNKEKNLTFEVDLINGIILFNHIPTEYNKDVYIFNKNKNNIRLIYTRRVREVTVISSKKEVITQLIWHILGFQYLDNNNINHKIILQIEDKTGFFVLGE